MLAVHIPQKFNYINSASAHNTVVIGLQPRMVSALQLSLISMLPATNFIVFAFFLLVPCVFDHTLEAG